MAIGINWAVLRNKFVGDGAFLSKITRNEILGNSFFRERERVTWSSIRKDFFGLSKGTKLEED